MVAESGWRITSFTRQARYDLLRLLDQHTQVHYHLDWESVRKWLNDPNNFIALAWHHDSLQGVMAFSPPHRNAMWLRLLALPRYTTEEIVFALWQHILELLPHPAPKLCALVMRPWLIPYLQKMGFVQTDTVINMVRQAQRLLYHPPETVKIRGLWLGESGRVLDVDHAAFGAMWQMRETELREASRRSNYYRVAVAGGQIIGYQLSTRYSGSMHLARLATLPQYQGRGIASQLVYDLLDYADRHQVDMVTVNTQLSNAASQRVYDRFGFERDHTDFPVFTCQPE